MTNDRLYKGRREHAAVWINILVVVGVTGVFTGTTLASYHTNEHVLRARGTGSIPKTQITIKMLIQQKHNCKMNVSRNTAATPALCE